MIGRMKTHLQIKQPFLDFGAEILVALGFWEAGMAQVLMFNRRRS